MLCHRSLFSECFISIRRIGSSNNGENSSSNNHNSPKGIITVDELQLNEYKVENKVQRSLDRKSTRRLIKSFSFDFSFVYHNIVYKEPLPQNWLFNKDYSESIYRLCEIRSVQVYQKTVNLDIQCDILHPTIVLGRFFHNEAIKTVSQTCLITQYVQILKIRFNLLQKLQVCKHEGIGGRLNSQ